MSFDHKEYSDVCLGEKYKNLIDIIIKKYYNIRCVTVQ